MPSQRENIQHLITSWSLNLFAASDSRKCSTGVPTTESSSHYVGWPAVISQGQAPLGPGE